MAHELFPYQGAIHRIHVCICVVYQGHMDQGMVEHSSLSNSFPLSLGLESLCTSFMLEPMDPSGEGNGNPLCTLFWKILWMEEPGRLQSMGS